MKNKLKNFIKWIYFYCDNYFLKYFVKNSKSIESNQILLIRTDNIGDFILWLWEAQKLKEVLKDIKITLICNSVYSKLAEETKYFDKVIPLDIKKYNFNLKYKINFLRELNKQKYKKIINPVNSRSVLTESLVKNLEAVEKIGNYGDDTSLNKYLLKVSSKNYTKIFKENIAIREELLKNLSFYNWCFNKKTELKKPIINFEKELINNDIIKISNQNYYIFSLGASLKGKCWEIKKFRELYLKKFKNSEMSLILVGSNSEVELGNQFLEGIDEEKIINLIGKTNLFELIYLVKKSNYIVCNDSLILHLAALEDISAICILGCWQYQKVLPYLDDSKEKIKYVDKRLECFDCNFKCKYKDMPFRCIKNIKVEDVIRKIENKSF